MTLFDLERRLAGIGQRLSAAEAAALIAEDFVEFGKSGKVWTKAEIVAAMAGWPAIDAELQDFKMRELGANVCLVTYRLVSNAGATLRSSIWRKNGEHWQIIFHQGTSEKSAAR